MSDRLRGLGRRAALLGGAATALTAGGCTVTAPTGRPDGIYHFTMPPGRDLAELEAGLTAILGPTRRKSFVDLGKPGLDAGDIVTMEAPPPRDNLTANALVAKVRDQLGLADFEADIEAAPVAEWMGRCRFDPESRVAGNQEVCTATHGAPTDFAWPLRNMNVPDAWAWSIESGRPAYGEGVLVGHLDTGVASHVELEGGAVIPEQGINLVEPKLKGGFDPLANTRHLDQIGHGTATASVIVSRGGVGSWPTRGFCGGTTGPGRITGTAPAAVLLPVRVFRFAATSNLARVATGINFLRERSVGVMTMALGWPIRSNLLDTAIRNAVDANIIVLAAAGNFDPYVVYPAKFPHTIAVGAVGPNDEAWCGGARGPEVAVSAPGDKVWRAFRGDNDPALDDVSPRAGTSFAVSLTAGVAALWLAHHGRDALIAGLPQSGHPNLQSLFRANLQRTARRPTGWSLHGGMLGAGVVDAGRLLRTDPFASA